MLKLPTHVLVNTPVSHVSQHAAKPFADQTVFRMICLEGEQAARATYVGVAVCINNSEGR